MHPFLCLMYYCSEWVLLCSLHLLQQIRSQPSLGGIEAAQNDFRRVRHGHTWRLNCTGHGLSQPLEKYLRPNDCQVSGKINRFIAEAQSRSIVERSSIKLLQMADRTVPGTLALPTTVRMSLNGCIERERYG